MDMFSGTQMGKALPQGQLAAPSRAEVQGSFGEITTRGRGHRVLCHAVRYENGIQVSCASGRSAYIAGWGLAFQTRGICALVGVLEVTWVSLLSKICWCTSDLPVGDVSMVERFVGMSEELSITSSRRS